MLSSSQHPIGDLLPGGWKNPQGFELEQNCSRKEGKRGRRGYGGKEERQKKGCKEREKLTFTYVCAFTVNKDMSLKEKSSGELGRGCGQPAEPTVAGLGIGQLTSPLRSGRGRSGNSAATGASAIPAPLRA